MIFFFIVLLKLNKKPRRFSRGLNIVISFYLFGGLNGVMATYLSGCVFCVGTVTSFALFSLEPPLPVMKKTESMHKAPITAANIQVPFFQYIGGLLYTHELVTETCNISGQSPAFWVLNKYDQSKYHGSQNDQNDE
jgi:hypothetical protein